MNSRHNQPYQHDFNNNNPQFNAIHHLNNKKNSSIENNMSHVIQCSDEHELTRRGDHFGVVYQAEHLATFTVSAKLGNCKISLILSKYRNFFVVSKLAFSFNQSCEVFHIHSFFCFFCHVIHPKKIKYGYEYAFKENSITRF